MAYDENLADRIRAALGDRDAVHEQKMFGGIAFMLAGNMACGVIEDALLVRVGREASESALDEPHTRVMAFTGRPMRGFVLVDPAGTAAERDLDAWVARGADYAAALPPK